jgi:hypothetical protein
LWETNKIINAMESLYPKSHFYRKKLNTYTIINNLKSPSFLKEDNKWNESKQVSVNLYQLTTNLQSWMERRKQYPQDPTSSIGLIFPKCLCSSTTQWSAK